MCALNIKYVLFGFLTDILMAFPYVKALLFSVGIGLAVVDSEVEDLRSALSLLSFPDGRDRNWIKFRVQLSLKCGVSSCVYTYVATSADWLIL